MAIYRAAGDGLRDIHVVGYFVFSSVLSTGTGEELRSLIMVLLRDLCITLLYVTPLVYGPKTILVQSQNCTIVQFFMIRSIHFKNKLMF